jgi:hypothetical protein
MAKHVEQWCTSTQGQWERANGFGLAMQLGCAIAHVSCMGMKARMEGRAAWSKWRPAGMLACATQLPQGVLHQLVPHAAPSQESSEPAGLLPRPKRSPRPAQGEEQTPGDAPAAAPPAPPPSDDAAETSRKGRSTGSSSKPRKQPKPAGTPAARRATPRSKQGDADPSDAPIPDAITRSRSRYDAKTFSTIKVPSTDELPPVALQLLCGDQDLQMLQQGLEGMTLTGHANVLAACAREDVQLSADTAAAWGAALMPLLRTAPAAASAAEVPAPTGTARHAPQAAASAAAHEMPGSNPSQHSRNTPAPPLDAPPAAEGPLYAAEEERQALVQILISLGLLNKHLGPEPMAALLGRMRRHLRSLKPQQLVGVLQALAVLEFYPFTLDHAEGSGSSGDGSSSRREGGSGWAHNSWLADALRAVHGQLRGFTSPQVWH